MIIWKGQRNGDRSPVQQQCTSVSSLSLQCDQQLSWVCKTTCQGGCIWYEILLSRQCTMHVSPLYFVQVGEI